MASPQSIRLFEGVYEKVDHQVRSILDTMPGQVLRPATMKFGWTGGGQPIAVTVDPITLASVPTNADPMELDVPFACRIVWARLKAGDAAGMPVSVDATVDVQLSQFTTFGGQTPLYGSGTIPTLTSASSVDLSLTGWIVDLVTADTITAKLTTFTGQATWVTLSLQLRPTDVTVGNAYTTSAGTVYTSANGRSYIFRS